MFTGDGNPSFRALVCVVVAEHNSPLLSQSQLSFANPSQPSCDCTFAKNQHACPAGPTRVNK